MVAASSWSIVCESLLFNSLNFSDLKLSSFSLSCLHFPQRFGISVEHLDFGKFLLQGSDKFCCFNF